MNIGNLPQEICKANVNSNFQALKKPDLPQEVRLVCSISADQMNTTNLSNQSSKDNQQELKRQQSYQSWHEPALNTLSRFLEKRKANLRESKRDEKNAAVTRDEFMQALVDEYGVHGLNLYHAGVIISSLYRAKRIRYLGSTFIQIMDEGESE